MQSTIINLFKITPVLLSIIPCHLCIKPKQHLDLDRHSKYAYKDPQNGAIYPEGLVVTGSHHYWQYVTILLVGGGEKLWDIILSANQENKENIGSFNEWHKKCPK